MCPGCAMYPLADWRWPLVAYSVTFRLFKQNHRDTRTKNGRGTTGHLICYLGGWVYHPNPMRKKKIHFFMSRHHRVPCPLVVLFVVFFVPVEMNSS